MNPLPPFSPQAGDVVESHAAYLPPPDAQALCAWALRLLQLYSAHNLVRGNGKELVVKGHLVLGFTHATACCVLCRVQCGAPL